MKRGIYVTFMNFLLPNLKQLHSESHGCTFVFIYCIVHWACCCFCFQPIEVHVERFAWKFDNFVEQEFKCEICGNYSYWGRRAFERHFKEWRHQHGMRCLGIPNTKNFNEITSIEVGLWCALNPLIPWVYLLFLYQKLYFS